MQAFGPYKVSKLHSNAVLTNGLFAAVEPDEYSIGNFEFNLERFYPSILFNHLDASAKIKDGLISGFMQCKGILLDLVETLRLSIEESKLSEFAKLMENQTAINEYIYGTAYALFDESKRKSLLEIVPYISELPIVSRVLSSVH